MGSLAAYSIKSAILLSILFAIYLLTLGRQKDASIRRIALLGICAASIFLPSIYSLGFHVGSEEHTMKFTQPSPAVITGPIPVSIIERIITAVIVAGICMMAVGSIIGLTRILMLRTRTVYWQGHKFRIMADSHPSPFCFCANIYISEDDFGNLPEMILTHETSHVGHLHFIDLFIGRVLLILQWWNPLAWLLSREMQQVHEYQADNDVLNAGYDRKEYQYLLLNRTIGDTGYSLVSGFKHSGLKERLRMINRENPDRRKIFTFLIIMLITSSFAGFALPNSSIILLINDRFSAIDIDSFRQTPDETEAEVSENHPHVIVDGKAIPYESINSIDRNAIESISVRKDQPEYPYGVIEIETKTGMDIYKSDDSPQIEETEKLTVVAYGTQKKY